MRNLKHPILIQKWLETKLHNKKFNKAEIPSQEGFQPYKFKFLLILYKIFINI